MIQIKRFMDKVSLMESRQSKDVVIPMSEARNLRDEIAKLLSDLYEFSNKSIQEKSNEVIDIQVKGGSFK
jgi:hypothetical protein